MFFFREKGIESKKQHIFFVKENNNNRHLYGTKFSFQEKIPTFESLKSLRFISGMMRFKGWNLGDDGVGENRKILERLDDQKHVGKNQPIS